MYQNPQNMRFGGGMGETSLHPAVIAALLVTIALTFLLPRRFIIVPLLLTMMLAPFGQEYYVLGVHLYVGRMLILFGWIRIFSKRITSREDIVPGGLTPIDKIYILWAVFRAVATYLEFMEKAAAINQVAFLWDSLGGYFLFRYLVRDREDITRVLKTFALIVVVLAVTMSNERITATNVFGYIGGRLEPFIRDGTIRSQGPFTGPIPAGTFAATILCLFLWLRQVGQSAFWGFAGIIGSFVMIYTSASSTPLMTVPAAIIAIAFWPLRKHMRAVRWGMVAALLGLQLVMKAPVWMVINHVDLVGGNSSYHRAMLVDGFIRHFSDWWLIGVQSTAGWGWDMWDQANQFVAEGETGGLATFVCFILLISRSFGRLGTARQLADGDRTQEWSFWLLGAAMFSQIVSFFGISFSDQSIYGWYALLAIICAATAPMFATEREEGGSASGTLEAPDLTEAVTLTDHPVGMRA